MCKRWGSAVYKFHSIWKLWMLDLTKRPVEANQNQTLYIVNDAVVKLESRISSPVSSSSPVWTIT